MSEANTKKPEASAVKSEESSKGFFFGRKMFKLATIIGAVEGLILSEFAFFENPAQKLFIIIGLLITNFLLAYSAIIVFSGDDNVDYRLNFFLFYFRPWMMMILNGFASANFVNFYRTVFK